MWRRRNKKQVIDYLYNEMTSENKKEFESLLKKSPTLKKKVEDLNKMRSTLNKWKVSDSPKITLDPMMVYHGMNTMKMKHEARFPMWSKVALGTGVLMVLFAFLNLNITFSDRGFSISFGRLSDPVSSSMNNDISQSLDTNNQQLLNVVKTYIAESDQKQIDAIVRLIRDSEIKSSERRKFELKEIYAEIANLKLNTNNYLVNANRAIQGLFQYINDINPDTTVNGI